MRLLARGGPANPADPAAPATSRRQRRIPLVVWAVTAVHVGLLLTCSLLYPPFTGFDETQHVDAVLSIRYGDGWPAPQERELSVGVVRAATPNSQAAVRLPFSDDPVPPRDERPSLVSLGVEQPSTDQPLPNQITQHPPLYYATAAAVLAAVPGDEGMSYDRVVAVLRLVSVLLMAPLPVLAFATARVLRAGSLTASTAALLTLAVPQLQRVGSSVNNDAAYTLAFSCTVVLLARVATGDLRRRTVLLTGVTVGLALLTKGFALALPLALGVAFLVGGVRHGRSRWWLQALLCETVAFVVGGWWWLRNLVVYGTLQPSGWPPEYRQLLGFRPRLPGQPAPLGHFVDGSYELLSTRFFGGLGINYVGPATFPTWAVNTLVVVSLLAVVAAVVGARGSRAALLSAVVLPFLLTTAIVVYGIWTGYSYSLNFPGAQGRYLFGPLSAMAAAVALGLAVVARRGRRLLPGAAALLAVVLQTVGLRYVLRRSWWPLDDTPRPQAAREVLGAVVNWSPWPTAVTLAVLVGTVLAAVLVLVLVVRRAFTADAGELPPPAQVPTPVSPPAASPEPAPATPGTPRR